MPLRPTECPSRVTRHVSLRQMFDMITKERIKGLRKTLPEALEKLGATGGTMAIAD